MTGLLATREFQTSRTGVTRIIVAPGALANLSSSGALDELSPASLHFIVTDANVASHYLDVVQTQLSQRGLRTSVAVISPGEGSKRLSVLSSLARQGVARGIDRNTVVFSLGGGVVNNLAGMLAATLLRGVRLIHLPTSLLAQVDAAVDNKQAINTSQGKNLLGVIHPPSHVVIDTTVLQTLPIREVRNGLAEAAKMALCMDESFVDFLLNSDARIGNPEALAIVVSRSLELKLRLINHADHEYAETMNQYGHALGHALEHVSKGQLLHGEAIAVGMRASAALAQSRGIASAGTLEAHLDLFRRLSLDTQVPEKLSRQQLWRTAKLDKYAMQGRPRLGLLSDVGRAARARSGSWAFEVDKDAFLGAADDLLTA